MGMLKIVLLVFIFGLTIALNPDGTCDRDSDCVISGYKCCTGTTWCCSPGYICTGTSTCLSVGVIVGPIVVVIIIAIVVGIICYRRRRLQS